MSQFAEFFDSSAFMPHGHCYLWRPDVLWLNVGSDAAIAAAYFLIPLALIQLVRKRHDLHFNGLFLLFAAFIVVCGFTHAFEIWSVWHPDYAVQGLLKLVTALISLTTAVTIWPLIPRILAIPARDDLEKANASLRLEIDSRKTAEAELERRAENVTALERRQTALLLRQTEERFERLLEGVKEYAILTLDPSGLITSWNSGAERLAGYRAEEALGRHFSLFYPRDLADRGHPATALAIAAETDKFEEVVQHVRKDGSRFWAQLLITASRGDDGTIIGFTKITRDVSEARRLEAILKKETDRLRSVVDHIVDGIITINERFEIESWNPAARKIFGYEGHEVLGKNVRMLMPEPYRSGHDGYVSNYISTGQARIIGIGREVVGLRKDGTTFPMELAVSEWQMGQARYFTGIVRDITERKADESALLAGSARLRQQAELLDLSSDAIIVRNAADQRVIFWNRGAEALTGFSRLDALDHILSEVWTPELPEPVAAIENALRQHGSWKGEVRYRSANGQTIFLMSRWELQKGDTNHGDRILESLTDITARRAAEDALKESHARLEMTQRAARVAAWERNLSTDSLILSGDAEGVFGENTAVTGEIAIHPDDQAPLDRVLERARADGRDFTVDFRVQTAGGDRWLEAQGRVFYGIDGKPAFMRGITRDISAQRAAQEEREILHRSEREARAEAERLYRAAIQASQMKDEFLTTISHELRTPLTAVLGYASILLDDDALVEDQREALDIILRNGKAQLQLVNDLLDMSRIISGKLEFSVKTIDPQRLLTDATESVMLAARARRITLETKFDSDLGVVLGDEDRLRQVLWNILGNAIKFTPSGGRVSIAAHRAGSQLEIRVTDSGKGIDSIFLPHVFERFRQEDGSLTRQHGGLGLGLSISRHIVEAHGGSISAESPGLNRGATFTVRMPIRAVYLAPATAMSASGAEMAERIAVRPTERDPTILAGLRIATVDDEQDARTLVASVLRRSGAIVVSTASGGELTTTIEGDHFDLLVCDIGMPDQSGYSLIGGIRYAERSKGLKRIPAVALTAYAAPEDRARAIEAGYDEFVTKPVLPDELVAVISRLLGRKSEKHS